MKQLVELKKKELEDVIVMSDGMMEEIRKLIELKKKELEDVRKRRYEIEKELELKAKEVEALKRIEKIIEENPGISAYISVTLPRRWLSNGNKSEVTMG